MENNDVDKAGSAHGGFLKPHIFTLTVPQVTTSVLYALKFLSLVGLLCFLNTFFLKFCLCVIFQGGRGFSSRY